MNRKGFRPSIRRQRYKLQPYDLVKVEDKVYEVIGTHCYGNRVTIKNDDKKDSILAKKIHWHFSNGSLVFKK